MSASADVPAALVTGASRGIGRAVVLELARLGYAVVVNYATRPDAAAEVVQEILNADGRAVAVQANVGMADDRRRLIEETLRAFGRLDVLVNNAGITSVGRHDLLEATEESFDQVFDTNLKGPFFLSQLAARTMIGRPAGDATNRGKIINISSVSAYAVSTNRADYCMTKAALRMMTWLFAERLAVERIGVYEVCPGVIASDMTAPVKEKYDRLIAEGLWPIRRWGQPEDVARAVAAIVQDFFPFSTGECFNVDGGFHIRRL
jgi:NAD(P)-dependent dehydrogenase (short-subunit alcohol dehydrogenase family)